MIDEPRILPQDQVVRLVGRSDAREFSIFLGAGASRSSGVVLASEMIGEWRSIAFREQAPAGADFAAWCESQPWYRSPTEYSDLFEALYPDERARQRYVEPKIEAAAPGWGYLYLANIVRSGHFNLVFTTNFDDLVNDALTRAGYNAVVCAADSDVATINAATGRAKIIKLHGDYLFKSLKNTREELARLQSNMARKFGEFARQSGMLVLGYAGADESIMSLLETLLQDDDTFPNRIYWGLHDPAAPRPAALDALLAAHPKRLLLFRCEDFDIFMARLHRELQLPPPVTVVEPLQAAMASGKRLVAQTLPAQLADPTIRENFDRLQRELGGSIAQVSDASALELFEAQIALGRRDYANALPRIERYVAGHPNDAQALTMWGSALAIRAEEEGGADLALQAAAKWREAVQADPKTTVARYYLVRFHATRQQYREAVAEAEALIQLTPRDTNLRLNLIQLYGTVSRTREALQGVDDLLVADPDNAMLHRVRASLLEQRSLPAEALLEMQRAVRIAPADSWARIQSAQAYMRMGRPREAASEFTQAVQLDPGNAGLRIQAATFFFAINQPHEALSHLQEAVALEPASAEARGWLASVYMAVAQPDDAQREIKVAIKLDPTDSRVLATAGMIFGAVGKLDVAERHLKRAIESNPFAVGNYVTLMELYARSGRRGDVEETLRKVAQFDAAAAQQLTLQLAGQAAPQIPAGRSPGPR